MSDGWLFYAEGLHDYIISFGNFKFIF
jgi:hypothetical protein